jgi:hypothetical protein
MVKTGVAFFLSNKEKNLTKKLPKFEKIKVIIRSRCMLSKGFSGSKILKIKRLNNPSNKNIII